MCQVPELQECGHELNFCHDCGITHKGDNPEMRTAQEQFIEDFFLVADNDEKVYFHLKDLASFHSDIEDLATAIENEWEEMVSVLATFADENATGAAGDFLRQMMAGWGHDTFWKIAKQVVAE